jgi:hypothetical protein
MSRSLCSPTQRPLLALGAFVALAALLAVAVERTPADIDLGLGLDLGLDVVRVEEDWTLTLNEPNAAVASPQISTQMARAPYAPRFCNFHLNSCDIPRFAQGGLQLQVWKGSDTLAVQTSPNGAIMSTSNELVTWTQYIRKDGTVLKFGVKDASSTTWGDFSGMEVTIPNGTPDLNDYSSEYSTQNSGVTFGANRVTSMVLVRTRKQLANGTVLTDNTPHVIYSAVLDPALGGDN